MKVSVNDTASLHNGHSGIIVSTNPELGIQLDNTAGWFCLPNIKTLNGVEVTEPYNLIVEEN